MKPLTPILVSALLFCALLPAFGGKAMDRINPNVYPLRTCVVSGDELGGDMGEPYVFTYKDPNNPRDPGRVVKLCCKGCLDDFKKDPAAYLKKIDDARAKIRRQQ
jgi:hypothetical protein